MTASRLWFFSLDAANRVAVRIARRTYNLPYMIANMSMNVGSISSIQYLSHRNPSRRTSRGV